MNSDSSSTKSSDSTPSPASGGPITKNSSTGSQDSAGSLDSSTARLRQYSQELYDYTLGLLDAVKKEETKKTQSSKAYVMKRGVSDVPVARKREV